MSLTGQPVDDVLLSKVSNKVGTVVQSMLDETEFNNENPGVWKLMDGQSCAGSAYETLTGSNIVPDLVTNGEFIRQAKVGRVIGSPEGDAIRNITGYFSAGQYHGYDETSGAFYQHSQDSNGYGNANDSYRAGFDASRVVPTAPENRPKNIAVNHFIKTDY